MQYFVLMVQIFIGYLKSGYSLQVISKLRKFRIFEKFRLWIVIVMK